MSLPTVDEILTAAAEAVRTEGSAVLCQIVRVEGSTPGKPGWKLLVTASGRSVGNLGGGAFEALVSADARLALGQPSSPPEVKRYYLTEEARRGEATGMVCGGLVEVLIEVMTQRPLLLICGGGPVGQALARNGELCGFEITVVEDREEFLEAALFPDGSSLVRVGRDFVGRFLPRSARPVLAVVVTRCWETDLEALTSILDQSDGVELAYLGLLGSRRKVERVRAELTKRGLDLGDVDLRGPIGLSIGSETPAEIAISILAEIIQTIRDETARADDARPGRLSEAG